MIKTLKPQSHKKITFICDGCGKVVSQEYRNYLKQKNGHFCRRCRNKHTANREDVKKKQSEAAKKLWKNAEYRRKVSKSLSIACKKSWENDDRRKNLSENNPMKNKENREKVSENEATSVEELKEICKKHNYKYIGRKLGERGGVIVQFECDKGHYQEKRLYSFRQGSWRCRECTKSFSNGEREISRYIEEMGIKIVLNSYSFIFPFEIDILIPSKKIAIEYCGLFWHGELQGKDRKYHVNKLARCEEKGYRLITIFEDEWIYKQEIVKERLKYILGLETRRIYARKCKVEEIDTKNARDFINKYHIQGYAKCSIKIGLFYESELVSVMTFAKPSRAKGSRNDGNIWELNRFCTSCNVIGSASKLLKFFQQNYEWDKIFSYADRRWNTGKLYEKIGLKFEKITKPNYWYIDGQKRIYRFSFRKHAIRNMPLYDPNLSEWENMKNMKYDRIWDCGNIKYSIKNPSSKS